MSDPNVWQAHRAAADLSNTLASSYEEAMATGLPVSADGQRLTQQLTEQLATLRERLAVLGVSADPARPPQPSAGPAASDGRPAPARYADEALAPVIADGRLTGRFRDGYTEEQVNTAFAVLGAATGLRLVCVWEYRDGFGCGGNSQWFAEDSSGGLWDLAGDLDAWLTGERSHPGPAGSWVGRSVAHRVQALAWTDREHNYAQLSRL
ncbi:hypothetical protein [Streptomyces sp. NRRL S-350]|uniref:hypothetical protein n=1 Tax=Streptomyces sp. NRRL S-350 TaxID=1463902 RepID=UPI0006926110|nr:hypothetical protein [Streptomyces sp. NRRL S-350]